MTDQGKYIEINGVTTYYELHGHGDPIILLHGGLGTAHSSWSTHIETLSKKFQVLAFDGRGRGKSNNPSKEFS